MTATLPYSIVPTTVFTISPSVLVNVSVSDGDQGGAQTHERKCGTLFGTVMVGEPRAASTEEVDVRLVRSFKDRFAFGVLPRQLMFASPAVVVFSASLPRTIVVLALLLWNSKPRARPVRRIHMHVENVAVG